MKHFLLKFNAGVEIGARLAYVGHHARTKHDKIYMIIGDEAYHRRELEEMLKILGEKTNPIIDGCFTLIGHTIRVLCKMMPIWSLDVVARLMELFAISNYDALAKAYPQYEMVLKKMSASERDHEEYFRLGPIVYQNLQNLRASIGSGRT